MAACGDRHARAVDLWQGFSVDKYKLDKLSMQTWVMPRYGFQVSELCPPGCPFELVSADLPVYVLLALSTRFHSEDDVFYMLYCALSAFVDSARAEFSRGRRILVTAFWLEVGRTEVL